MGLHGLCDLMVEVHVFVSYLLYISLFLQRGYLPYRSWYCLIDFPRYFVPLAGHARLEYLALVARPVVIVGSKIDGNA